MNAPDAPLETLSVLHKRRLMTCNRCGQSAVKAMWADQEAADVSLCFQGAAIKWSDGFSGTTNCGSLHQAICVAEEIHLEKISSHFKATDYENKVSFRRQRRGIEHLDFRNVCAPPSHYHGQDTRGNASNHPIPNLKSNVLPLCASPAPSASPPPPLPQPSFPAPFCGLLREQRSLGAAGIAPLFLL